MSKARELSVKRTTIIRLVGMAHRFFKKFISKKSVTHIVISSSKMKSTNVKGMSHRSSIHLSTLLSSKRLLNKTRKIIDVKMQNRQNYFINMKTVDRNQQPSQSLTNQVQNLYAKSTLCMFIFIIKT